MFADGLQASFDVGDVDVFLFGDVVDVDDALAKVPKEPWLSGRIGVRFVFVVVVACSSLLCLARAHPD